MDVPNLPWRPGVAAFVSDNGTDDRGFESRQGVRILGLLSLHC
jgi:hypothetical protein